MKYERVKESEAEADNLPPSYLPGIWKQLARLRLASLALFHSEAEHHFAEKLAKLSERYGDDLTDEQVDYYVDERDELEDALQLARFFSAAQSYAIANLIFVKLIEDAMQRKLLGKEILGKRYFVEWSAIRRGFTRLKLALSTEDDASLATLRQQRNDIMHNGGWHNPPGSERLVKLSFEKSDIHSIFRLIQRCVNMIVDEYDACYVSVQSRPTNPIA